MEDSVVEKAHEGMTGMRMSFRGKGVSVDAWLDKIDDVPAFVDKLDDVSSRIFAAMGRSEDSEVEKSFNVFSVNFADENLVVRLDAGEIENINESLSEFGTIVDQVKTMVTKAVWSTAFVNDLPDSSFFFVESGEKDSGGKTTPRSLRHLPYKDKSGKVDLPHLRNAIARANQVKLKDGSKISESKANAIKAKAQKILARLKKGDEVDEGDDFEWLAPVVKADADRRLIYGVVYKPDEEDSQGDMATAEEIEKAAHQYMKESRFIDIHHESTVDHDQAIPVESYIAPVDMEINDHIIAKGSWIMVTYVEDENIWADVKKGDMRSYSIRGFGRRVEV